MLILLCILLSAAMLLAIDLLSYSLNRKGWLRFATTFLLFYSQIIATEFLLGLVSSLYRWTLVALNLLITTVVLYVLYKRDGRTLFRNYFKSLRVLPINFKQTVRSDPIWAVLLLMAAGLLAWIIFLGLIFPVTDFDGNSYHLTYVAEVIQNHKLYDAPTSLVWLTGYPKGGEFIQLWSMLITRNDAFADLTQVPFLFLGIYALYTISLRLGAQKKNARFAALLFLFLPIVINQLKTTYVDVILCTVFFAGLAMVIQKTLSKLDLLLIGVIFSLLISVKSTGFLFVLVLLPFLFWRLYQMNGKSYRKYLPAAALLILPCMFGLYWYAKDYMLYHSPIYPFGFQIAGHSLFPGKTFQQFGADAIAATSLPNSTLGRIWYVWTEQKDWFGCLYNYDTNYAGLGPIWFVILIPAIVVGFYSAIRRRNLLYLSVFAAFSFLFLIYPSDYYSRYTMFIAGLGIISLALVHGSLHNLAANLIKLLAIILTLGVIGTNFVLCNFPPGTVHIQLKSFIHGAERGPIYDNTPGRAFVFMENTEQAGDITAYSSNPYFIYPIWKADFSNRVIFIPAAGKNNWYQKVSSQHVKYIFATTSSKEEGWANQRYKLLYKDEMYEIYKVY